MGDDLVAVIIAAQDAIPYNPQMCFFDQEFGKSDHAPVAPALPSK